MRNVCIISVHFQHVVFNIWHLQINGFQCDAQCETEQDISSYVLRAVRILCPPSSVSFLLHHTKASGVLKCPSVDWATRAFSIKDFRKPRTLGTVAWGNRTCLRVPLLCMEHLTWRHWLWISVQTGNSQRAFFLNLLIVITEYVVGWAEVKMVP